MDEIAAEPLVGAAASGRLAHGSAARVAGMVKAAHRVAMRPGRRRWHVQSRFARFAVLAGLAAIALGSFGLEPAWVQTNQKAAIALPATIVAQPSAQVAFPIRIGPVEAVPRSSFVRVRGLPPMAALSEGHSIAPGSWAIPIAALNGLQLMLPAGTSGRSDVSVTLVGIDGTVLAEARCTLAIAAAAVPPPPEQARRDIQPPASMLRAGIPLPTLPERIESPAPPQGGPALTPQDRERALRLVEKGSEQLQEGNVSQARLLFERAADAGLAAGAMSLAGTFDATELARLGVRGIRADNDSAKRWYERARQLGASEADQRLRRLGAR
jgi:hypothetical protein